MSSDHICARGHRWQKLPACPVCGAAPRKSAEASALEQCDPASLPMDALPPLVSSLPILKVLDPQPGTSTPPAELPQVAGYEVLQVLGQGAMGVVYLAWQTGLARLVALKTVLAGEHAGPGALARFHTEAEAAARLVHPHIVQIYEIGDCDGQPFLAMEYVEGGNLSARLNGKPQPALAAATFVAMLAEAVHHAHQRGIIHRDLKPANILLVQKTPVQGHTTMHAGASSPDLGRFEPKITDFSLAKLVIGGISRTARGAILGTPAYMAPEQASGALDPVGPAADIHGLGAILYELLTGRPPFLASSVPETLEQVRNLEPVSPRRLVATIPRDLETVCLKCLRKEPARRYESALALAEDLRRVQEGEPVRGRLVPVWGRGLRWVRRHPAWAALSLVSCLVVAALTAWAVGLAYNARLQTLNTGLEAAVGQVKTSHDALSRLERWDCYVRDIRLADEAWQGGQVRRLRELLDGCPPDLRGWEWHYLHGLASKAGRSLPHQAGVLAVAFHPDRRHLASGCSDGSVWFWDISNDKVRTAQECHPGGVWSIAFSPNGGLLASAGEDHLVRLWNPEDGRLIQKLAGHRAPVRSIAFSRDGTILASASKDGTIQLWDPGQGRVLHSLPGHKGGVLVVTFAPDGRFLASGGTDHMVRVWDADRGVELRGMEGHTGDVYGLAFSPDGKTLASTGTDGTLRTWDPASGLPRTVYWRADRTALYAVAFGSAVRIAMAGDDHRVYIWNGARMLTFRGHNDRVGGVAFSPDGRQLASASLDGNVKLWNVDISQEYRVFPRADTTVLGARFSPDDRRLIDVAENGTIRIWDVKTGKLLQQQTASLDRPRSIAFRSDGQLLAAFGSHGTIKCWDLVKAQALSGSWRHDAPVRAVALSPDGRRLASGSDDGKVRIWDVAGEAPPFICPGHTPPIHAVVFSPDSSIIVSGGTDGVRLWDARTGKELPPLPDPTPRVTVMAFGPDGHLAVAQMDGHITRWDLAARRRLGTLIGHSSMIGALVFTPDGTRLASASHDMSVRLWDTARGQEVLSFHGFASEVVGMAFSTDGRRLVTTEPAGSVKLWEIERE